jgi:hypothetical protein
MTILWIIERLLVRKVEGTLTDVVITADWRCNGSQDNYSGTCYGSASFAPPSGSFTPYEDLTQDQVLSWCFANGVDQAAIEANVTAQIENQINPPVIAPPLPWVPVVEIVPPLVEQKLPWALPPVVSLPLPWVPPLVEQKVPVLVAEPATVVEAPVA